MTLTQWLILNSSVFLGLGILCVLFLKKRQQRSMAKGRGWMASMRDQYKKSSASNITKEDLNTFIDAASGNTDRKLKGTVEVFVENEDDDYGIENSETKEQADKRRRRNG